jgi:hypothetical protein
MSRIVKQIFYGVFYLIVFGTIATGIFFRYLKPAASCFDLTQNEGEQGIDCGGPCANVCTGNLESLQSEGGSVFPNGSGRATLLMKVSNPNRDLGASAIPYVLTVSDTKTGAVGALISGATFLYPDQSRYLVWPNYPITGDAASGMVSDLAFATSGIAWLSSSTMGLAPQFKVSNVVTTSTDQGIVLISGVLGNLEPIGLRNIEVDIVFEDRSHTPIGATRTMIDTISANGNVSFSASYPLTIGFVPENTIVAAYALR